MLSAVGKFRQAIFQFLNAARRLMVHDHILDGTQARAAVWPCAGAGLVDGGGCLFNIGAFQGRFHVTVGEWVAQADIHGFGPADIESYSLPPQ